MNITAVEWLVNKVYMVIPDSERNFLEGLKEMAKEKEKEQIINAHGLRYSDITEETVTGEQYYNKTFNQDSELPKEDKTFKQKSKWTKLYEEVLEKEEEEVDHKIIIEELREAVTQMKKEIRLLKNATRPLK